MASIITAIPLMAKSFFIADARKTASGDADKRKGVCFYDIINSLNYVHEVVL